MLMFTGSGGKAGGGIGAGCVLLVGAVLWGGAVVGDAASARAQQTGLIGDAMPPTALQVVQRMIAHEDDDRAHMDQYEFLSRERSDRTGGHVWTERVAETSFGRIRFLLEVDGKPLSADQEAVERGRLARIVADPEAFVAQEREEKRDEAQDRKMLDLLPRAFVFDNVQLEGGVWRMEFHPNPAYSPHGFEERVLGGMSGTVVIDGAQERLMQIDGRLPEDVSIGFGLLATVRAGSSFSSQRADKGGHWRTVHVETEIEGKAALFKSVSRNTDITRSEFKYLQPGITIAEAVALVESSEGGAVIAGN